MIEEFFSFFESNPDFLSVTATIIIPVLIVEIISIFFSGAISKRKKDRELEQIYQELSKQNELNHKRKLASENSYDPEYLYSMFRDIRRSERIDEEIAFRLSRISSAQAQLQEKIERIDLSLTSSGVYNTVNEAEAIVLLSQIANMTNADYLLNLLKDNTEKQHILINNVLTDLFHTIRTPLSGIPTILLAISVGNVSDEKMKEYLSQIQQCVSQVEENMEAYRRILSQNTDTSAISSMGFIDRLIARLKIAALSSRKQLNVDYQGLSELELIPSVAERVLLAVDCIIENAADFANDNSTLRVFSSIEDGIINIHIENDGNTIDSDNKDQIFDKGYSTRTSTGRGLYLVKTVIKEQLGGDVDFENILTPTKGVRFSIALDANKCIPKERENDRDGKGINT